MASIQYYDVIIRPVITEKSMNAMGEKKYTFLVHPEANKTQIKEAVEKMFEGTKVKSVNTINNDGKKKRRGMVVGKTAKTKKAIVALTEESKDIGTAASEIITSLQDAGTWQQAASSGAMGGLQSIDNPGMMIFLLT